MSAAVLLLAAFNVSFRLGLESVGEWDESLYATTAWEMTRTGELVGTTFDGVLDYYNSKPPLNVWLIATSFKLLGVSLVSLRVPSALCAIVTVAVFLWWARRFFGSRVSLIAGAVLATSFGYLHIHAARSGNPDAILTLAIVLVVVVLSGVSVRPWRRVWLGPILSAVFLLKGAAVLQPLLLITLFETFARGSLKRRLSALGVAALIAVVVAGGWAFLRWCVDGWAFLRTMVQSDFLTLTLTQMEGHVTGYLFYFEVLQRYQYEWVIAAAVAMGLTCRTWTAQLKRLLTSLRQRDELQITLASWGITTLAVPTAMQTRLAWYLTPFYPLFALLVGLAIVHALRELHLRRRARLAVIAVTVAALICAESKSLWRLFRVTNLNTSVQGLLMSQLHPATSRRVYRDRLSRAEAFVVRAVLGAEFVVEPSLVTRPRGARRGDLVIVGAEGIIPGLTMLGRRDGWSVHVVN